MDVMLFDGPLASIDVPLTFSGCSLPGGSVSKADGKPALNQALLVLFVSP